MRTTALICAALAAVSLQAQSPDTFTAFPKPGWFREHLTRPQTRVELQAPRRLGDFVIGGKLELSLRAYIELALANNTDIALARLQVESPANAITRAFAAYDPLFQASYSDTRATSTSISNLDGVPTVKTTQQPFSASYQQALPSGTAFAVQYSASRYATNNTYSTFNPSLSSNLTAQFQYQLMRDRGGAFTKLSILQARSTLKISRLQLRDQVTAIIAAAESAYWDAVEARENLALYTKFTELRAAALDRVQKQVDAKAALPIDLYQPKSEYASAQLLVTQGKRALAQRENALRQQVGADLDPAIRNLPIQLTEAPEVTATAPPDKEESVKKALAARPDRLALAAALESDDLSIRRAGEALRPTVTATGSYQSQGIGGNYLPANAAGGLGDALNQMLRFGSPVYTLGIRLSLPVHDHAGAADLADAQVRKRQDALQLRRLEQNLRHQTLDAVDNLVAARASLEQAEQARDFAQKRFEAEQKKYELGIELLYFVLSAQTDLNAAANAVLEQTINYRRNLISFYQVTGQLLEERGVTLN
jgi:outer membrane protein